MTKDDLLRRALAVGFEYHEGRHADTCEACRLYLDIEAALKEPDEPEGCYGIPTDSELLELLKDAFLKTDSDIRLRDDVATVLLRYNALNGPAEPTTERCSICGSTAGPTSTHPHLPGYK